MQVQSSYILPSGMARDWRHRRKHARLSLFLALLAAEFLCLATRSHCFQTSTPPSQVPEIESGYQPAEQGELRFGEVASDLDDVEGGMKDLVTWLVANGVTGMEPGEGPIEHYILEEGADSSEGASCTGAEAHAASEPKTRTRPEMGVRAREDIPEPQVLLHFPNKMLISADKLAEDEPDLMPYDIKAGSCFWTGYSVVASWLLRERAKGVQSFWHPYIRMLPSFVPSAITFDRELLEGLDYDRLKENVDFVVDGYKDEYSKCNKSRLANATFSEFVWAMSILGSRSFGSEGTWKLPGLGGNTTAAGVLALKAGGGGPAGSKGSKPGRSGAHRSEGREASGEGARMEGEATATHSSEKASFESEDDGTEDDTSLFQQVEGGGGGEEEEQSASLFESPVMLVPYIDLVNHDHNNFNSFWKPMGADFYLISIRPVERGMPILSHYGSKSSDEYLMGYGFIPSPGAHDFIPLFTSLQHVLDHFANHTEGIPQRNLSETRGGGEWALQYAHKAQVAVRPNLMSPEYSEERTRQPNLVGDYADHEFLAWQEGRVEPRLLAIFAALWFSWTHNYSEAEYDALGNASVAYGLQFRNTDCAEMASWLPPGHTEAMGMAAQLVRKRTQVMVRGYAHTVEQDKERVALVTFCREAAEAERRGSLGAGQCQASPPPPPHEPTSNKPEGKTERSLSEDLEPGSRKDNRSLDDDPEVRFKEPEEEVDMPDVSYWEPKYNFTVAQCSRFRKGRGGRNAQGEWDMESLRDWALALELQLDKKMQLLELKDRMAWTCDPAYEAYRQAILYGVEGDIPDEDDIL